MVAPFATFKTGATVQHDTGWTGSGSTPQPLDPSTSGGDINRAKHVRVES